MINIKLHHDPANDSSGGGAAEPAKSERKQPLTAGESFDNALREYYDAEIEKVAAGYKMSDSRRKDITDEFGPSPANSTIPPRVQAAIAKACGNSIPKKTDEGVPEA